MKKLSRLLVAVCGCLIIFGCAAKEEYFVKEATAVKTDALEPVIFWSDKLTTSLLKIKPRFLSEQSEVDELMTQIKGEVEKTKRFKYVMVLKTKDVTDDREGFLIYPEVMSMKMEVRNTIDPKRKKYIASGSACLKVYDAYNASKEIETFTSKHHFEKMRRFAPGQSPTEQELNEQKKDLLRLIFVDLAIQLGDKFNPSYETGTIEKISAKTVYVHIKTDRLKGLKASHHQIAVIDDDNKPLASIEPISIEDGIITGVLYTKANLSIKPGMKVRARIYYSKNVRP